MHINLLSESAPLPIHLELDTIRKIIKRNLFGDKYLVFVHDNGERWSFYPAPVYGKQGLDGTIQDLIHRIMGESKKSVGYEEQKLVEKKIGSFTRATWQTIST